MSTGDLRIDTYTGKILSAQDTQLRFYDNLEKYSADILAPWEITEGTGFVGNTTIEKLNTLLGS